MPTGVGLLELVAVRRGHFRLESGYHADTWLELDRLATNPAALEPFAAMLANKISEHRVEVVCGPMTGGAFLAELLAVALRVDFCWAERFQSDRRGLFDVDYRIPSAIKPIVTGRRVAVVDDAISTGSAVRGTLLDLNDLGAHPVCLGALLVLGATAGELAAARGLPLERLVDQPFRAWMPDECPMCESSTPLER